MDLVTEILEACDEFGNFRSFAYMRPLSIWAIKWAVDRKGEEQ